MKKIVLTIFYFHNNIFFNECSVQKKIFFVFVFIKITKDDQSRIKMYTCIKHIRIKKKKNQYKSKAKETKFFNRKKKDKRNFNRNNAITLSLKKLIE